MSDDCSRATQSIAMTAPRIVDATQWLFVGCDTDGVSNSRARDSAVLPSHFGKIRLGWFPEDTTCGAIFVSESDGSVNPHAAGLLHYFFTRDGEEARVFEFDKFERHFYARRWDQIEKRIR